MTARVGAREMDAVKHHLIDYLSAAQEPDDFMSMV